MSKDKEVVEDKPIEFDVMPGADKDSEVFEQLDLSFPEVEEPKACLLYTSPSPRDS
mgnify:CR=1 FL=1